MSAYTRAVEVFRVTDVSSDRDPASDGGATLTVRRNINGVVWISVDGVPEENPIRINLVLVPELAKELTKLLNGR